MAQLIYIIEDDTALRRELAHLLELSGYRAARASSAARAKSPSPAAAR